MASEPPAQPSHRLADAALAAVAIVLVMGGLGSLDLWAPDEPRYAQIAEELRRMDNGPSDLVLLRLGGEPYTQKPPLYFWLAASLGAVRGSVDEWAARLPSAVAGLASLAVWVALGRRLFPGSLVGWMTGALLLTSFRFVHFARRAQLDVVLMLLESLCLWAFVAWHEAGDSRQRRNALIVLHASTALALLTKGPVGLLPWACFAVVLASEGRAREIRTLLPLPAVAATCLPVLAWIGACVALAPAGFFEAAIVENLWSRFTEGTDHARPLWYFVFQLPVEALPWSILWPACALWAWRHRTRPGGDPQEADPGVEATRDRSRFAGRLMATWVAVPFVFFSLSAGKRGIYMLPALPALCLWVAVQLDHVRREGGARRWLDGPTTPLLLCAALGTLAAFPWPSLESDPGDIARSAMTLARSGLFVVAAVSAAVALVLARFRGAFLPSRMDLPWGALLTWATVGAIWAVVLFGVLPILDAEKSPRPIAEATIRSSRADEPVGLFGQRTLMGGLLFYGERPLVLLETVEAVQEFQADGGRIVVVRARHAPWLEAATPFRTLDRFRRGRREQWIVELLPTLARECVPECSHERGMFAYVPDSLNESADAGLSGADAFR